MPKPAPGPADKGSLSFFTQACLPLSSDTASTSPLSLAANTKPLSIAGPSPSRSLACFLPPPTLSPPYLLDRQRRRKIHELGGQLDVFILAAASRDQHCRGKAQGK